ncbi:hypothetical protein Tco_0785314 [Tanacetum coccineum]
MMTMMMRTVVVGGCRRVAAKKGGCGGCGGMVVMMMVTLIEMWQRGWCCGDSGVAVIAQAKEIQALKAQVKKLKKGVKPLITHHKSWMKSVALKIRLARKTSLKKKGIQKGYEVDINKKTEKPSQNDKTEHGMEKTVQNQGQSPKMPKSESILKNTID